ADVYPADGRRDDLHGDAFFRRGRAQSGQGLRVRAVGNQDAELAPGEVALAVPPALVAAEDAQRRGGGEVMTRLAGGRRRRGQFAQAEALGHLGRERLVHVPQPGHHAGPDLLPRALAQLKRERLRDMRALDVGLADVELARLAVVVGQALRAERALGACHLFLVTAVARRGVLTRTAVGARPRVRLVVCPGDRVAH